MNAPLFFSLRSLNVGPAVVIVSLFTAPCWLQRASPAARPGPPTAGRAALPEFGVWHFSYPCPSVAEILPFAPLPSVQKFASISVHSRLNIRLWSLEFLLSYFAVAGSPAAAVLARASMAGEISSRIVFK